MLLLGTSAAIHRVFVDRKRDLMACIPERAFATRAVHHPLVVSSLVPIAPPI